MNSSKIFPKLLLIAFIASLPILSSAQASQSWTLEQCIEYAIENNIQIKQAGLAVDFNQNQFQKSKYDRLPTLNAQIGNDYNFGRSLTFQNTYESTNSIGVYGGVGTNVLLWNAGVMQNSIKQRELDLMASVHDLQKVKDDIALSVAALYLEVLFAQEIQSLDENQLDITEQRLKSVNQMIEAGSMPVGASLELQAQKAREEYQLVNSQNNVRLAYLNLYQLLELPAEKSFIIEMPETEIDVAAGLTLESAAVFERARNSRPEIQASLLRVQSAQKQIEIARGAAYPRVTFGANYYNNFNDNFTEAVDGNPLDRQIIPFFTQLKNNQRYGFSFNVSIPIFNGFQTRTNVSNAKINALDSEYRLHSSLKTLHKDIEQAYASALSAHQRYISSIKSVEAALEAFRYVEQRHTNGLATTVEYNQTKNDLAVVQSQQLQAKFDYIFRSKILDFYNGIPISL